jgi:hypothetical protein
MSKIEKNHRIQGGLKVMMGSLLLYSPADAVAVPICT